MSAQNGVVYYARIIWFDPLNKLLEAAIRGAL